MTNPAISLCRDRPVVIINHLIEQPNAITGITRYLFGLLTALVPRGRYKYVLLTTWTADKLPAELRSGNLTVVTLPFVRSLPLNLLFQTVVMPYYMRKYTAVAEFNCEPLACFLPFWRRLVTLHDLYVLTLPKMHRLRDRVWWRVFFPAAILASNTIICVSGSTKEKLVRYYPYAGKKAAVVYEASALITGRDLSVYRPPRGRFGLYVGNVTPSKNIGILVQALAILERRGDPVEIVFVGHDKSHLLAAAMEKNRLRHAVRFAGFLSDEELAGLYGKASFLVTTSLDEGFCLPVVEAQTLALPVICPDISIYREIASDGALYYRPDAPEELAGCMETMLKDEAVREAVADQAVCNAKRFSWQSAAEQVEKLLVGR
jgi:glycosyltransferase involved in cell wall biosynthesis